MGVRASWTRMKFTCQTFTLPLPLSWHRSRTCLQNCATSSAGYSGVTSASPPKTRVPSRPCQERFSPFAVSSRSELGRAEITRRLSSTTCLIHPRAARSRAIAVVRHQGSEFLVQDSRRLATPMLC